MYYPCDLVMSSYRPLVPEVGMIFQNNKGEFWELVSVPIIGAEEFFKKNGYPWQPYIIDDSQVLIYPEEIGWVERDDDLYFLNIDDINLIVNEYDGNIWLQVEEEGEDVVPLYDENKVIIKYGEYSEEEETPF